MRFHFFWFVVSLLLICCGKSEKNEEGSSEQFVMPLVYNSLYADSVETLPHQDPNGRIELLRFVGKFAFEDSIDINQNFRPSLNGPDFVQRTLRIYPADTFDGSGFQIFVNYGNTVKFNQFYRLEKVAYQYYPIFIANMTSSDRLFLGKDRFVYGHQQAAKVDSIQGEVSFGSWKNIDLGSLFMCVNPVLNKNKHIGYYPLILKGQESNWSK
jgi:hypothetical protein